MAKNQKRAEKFSFLVLTLPQALIGHWETFSFWKVEISQVEENGINVVNELLCNMILQFLGAPIWIK